jgi:hypothetical protein
MKIRILLYFSISVTVLIASLAPSLAACAPADFQCEIGVLAGELTSANTNISTLQGQYGQWIGLLSGKVDKLDGTGKWIKACQVPKEGTSYIVPQGWTTKDCAKIIWSKKMQVICFFNVYNLSMPGPYTLPRPGRSQIGYLNLK